MNTSTHRYSTVDRTAKFYPKGPEARPARAGRYELRQRLGLGGMGAVYEAWDPELARRVAVKLMRPRARGDATEAQARLRREAQSMAALQHPNVLGVYDVGLTHSGVFLAMPLVDGPDVARWLREERPPWRKIVEVFIAAGHGLAAAHAAGIVHRDFKPTNVLVDRCGGVLVCDFGIAAFVEGDGQLVSAPMGHDARPKPTRITRKGTAVGTPAYMAPEQHEGRPVDARSDQFSFCVALFEALYGQLPFEGLTAQELWKAKKSPLPAPPPGCEVPRRVHAVLERGLSWSSQERYPSMDALLDELRQVARESRRLGAKRTALTACLMAGLGLALASVIPTGEQHRPNPEALTSTLAEAAPAACEAAVSTLPRECAEVSEAVRSFERARRLARDPRLRAEGIHLARTTRTQLDRSQCPSAVQLHAEVSGWLDAVEDMQPSPRPGA